MSTAKEMVARAKERVPDITPEELRGKLGGGDLLVVDVRDPGEVAQSGRLKGAVNVSRGMLEFKADPESPYHDPAFAKDRTVVVYCASGGRAALAGAALKDLGYREVVNLGGFKDAAEAGLETEPAAKA